MHDEFRSAECRGDLLRKALIKVLETQLLRKLDRLENVFSLSPHVDFLISTQRAPKGKSSHRVAHVKISAHACVTRFFVSRVLNARLAINL